MIDPSHFAADKLSARFGHESLLGERLVGVFERSLLADPAHQRLLGRCRQCEARPGTASRAI